MTYNKKKVLKRFCFRTSFLFILSHLSSQLPQCITIRPLYNVTVINRLGVILIDMRIVVRNTVTVEPPCVKELVLVAIYFCH